MEGQPPRDGLPPLPRHAAPRRPCKPKGQCWARTPAQPGVADPNSPPRGRAVGGGRAPELRRPPPGTPSCPPRATTAHGSARCGAVAGSPRPHQPHPGNTGRGTLAACPKRQAAGGGTAPDTRRPLQRWKATPPGTASHHPWCTPPPAGHASQRDSAGPPRPHSRAYSMWVADPDSPPRKRAAVGGRAPELRRPSQRRKASPPGTPSCQPKGRSAGSVALVFGSGLCLGSGFGYAPPLLAGVMGCGCVCLGSGFGCAPPFLAGVLAPVCVCVRAPLLPRHSWLGCAVWVFVLGLRFRLCPATPGWSVGACVCLCARSAYTPPLLAGVCAVHLCVGARFSAVPRHSWPGCWGVCVLVCPPRLYRATPGWAVRCGCVCLGSYFSCARPLLAGVLGCLCACVCAPLVPRHSWLGCAVWVCVLGLGFWLHPTTPGCSVELCVFVCALRLYHATPGWGVRCGCVCSGSGFGCAPPLLAGVLGFVCGCVRTPLVPCHSWLGCACLGSASGCAPPLLAGVLGCARLCARSTCTPPLPAGVCGVGVCARAWVSAAPRHPCLGCWGLFVFVCALRLYPTTPGWGVRCGCGCSGSGFGCAPPHLAGVLGCVCPPVCAPLVPRHSWLGCAVWVCVLGLGFPLRPATPGWSVGVCVFVRALCLYPAAPGWAVRCGRVCLGSSFACAPPLLAGVCGVGVCA